MYSLLVTLVNTYFRALEAESSLEGIEVWAESMEEERRDNSF